jgi:hypothetical protein
MVGSFLGKEVLVSITQLLLEILVLLSGMKALLLEDLGFNGLK